MSAYRYVTLTCDVCGEIWDDGQSLKIREARANAKAVGWVSKGNHDECPLHHGWVRSSSTGTYFREGTF